MYVFVSECGVRMKRECVSEREVCVSVSEYVSARAHSCVPACASMSACVYVRAECEHTHTHYTPSSVLFPLIILVASLKIEHKRLNSSLSMKPRDSV